MLTYVLRGRPTAGRRYYTFSVPREIGDKIPSEARFVPVLTEEGILFRLAAPAELPSWANHAEAE